MRSKNLQENSLILWIEGVWAENFIIDYRAWLESNSVWFGSNDDNDGYGYSFSMHWHGSPLIYLFILLMPSLALHLFAHFLSSFDFQLIFRNLSIAQFISVLFVWIFLSHFTIVLLRSFNVVSVNDKTFFVNPLRDYAQENGKIVHSLTG